MTDDQHDEAPLPASTETSAPSSPPPAEKASPRKPLSEWAKAKGCDPESKGDEKHFYAGALARWHWVDSLEVTEAEFDDAMNHAKNLPIGNWPHPETKAEVR